MIRILHVVTIMDRGGLESMIMNYYRHIERDKIQFDFIVHRTKKGQYDDEIEQLGGKICRLPKLNPFSLSYHKALSDFFDAHAEYKIIHVHQDCLSSIILKEAWKHKIPVRIAHSHSSFQDKNIKYPIKLWYKQFIPKYATHLFACGEMAGRWMFGGSRFEIINNAIDTRKYIYNENKRKDMRRRLKVSDDTLLIGHVGSFSPVKNHKFMIDVFADVDKKANAKMLFVGNGALRSETEDKLRSLKLTDRAILVGVQPNVEDYLQAMDVFLFPSLYEGVPVSLVEAQAAGLPCVISDNVPKESIKTDLISTLPLDSPTEKWAELLISASETERKNTLLQIEESGFDIKKNASRLADFYLSQYNMIT